MEKHYALNATFVVDWVEEEEEEEEVQFEISSSNMHSATT